MQTNQIDICRKTTVISLIVNKKTNEFIEQKIDNKNLKKRLK